MTVKILCTREVEAKTGLHRTTIYRRRKEGTFITPVELGHGRIGYYEHELNDYLMSLKRASY